MNINEFNYNVGNLTYNLYSVSIIIIIICDQNNNNNNLYYFSKKYSLYRGFLNAWELFDTYYFKHMLSFFFKHY